MTRTQPQGGAFDPALERLTAAGRALDRLRPVVQAGAPWPLAAWFGTEPEAHWGPPEVLAHVAEMLPFWLGEVERVLDSATEPAPFGRVATDELRIATIERDRSLPVRELFDRIAAGISRYAGRLPQLTDAQAARRGLHPTRGELTVTEMIDRFVVSHLEEHVEQLATALADKDPPRGGTSEGAGR